MYFSTTTVPKRIRTVGRFNAPNPWRNNAPEEWSTEGYLMINAAQADSFVPPPQLSERKRKLLYGAEFVGIRSESDGRYHMLPESLSQLWQTKRVPTEALPRLLRDIEPQLKQRDFRRNMSTKTSLWATGLFFLFALCLLTLLYYFSFSSSYDYSAQQAMKTTNAAWFARPMKEGEFVYGDNGITLEGATPLRSTITPPSGAGAAASQNYVLGWFRAGEEANAERRLMLIGDYRPNTAYLLYGTTYSPATLGLSAQTINEFKTRIKNLNSDQILCFGWNNAGSTGTLHWPGTGFTIVALVTLAITLLPLMLVLVLRRRPRKQMDWLLARL